MAFARALLAHSEGLENAGRGPLGYAAYSSLRVLRKVSFTQFMHNTSTIGHCSHSEGK